MYSPWNTTLYQSPRPTNVAPQPVLPASLAKHPQQWTKDEVSVWLKWCVEEYGIEMVPADKFDMNGKALCLLNRSDFMERVPKNGDILFNALQKLVQKNANYVLCPPITPYPPIIPATTVSYPVPQQLQTSVESQSQSGLVLITTDSTQTTPIYSSKVRPILPHPHAPQKLDTCIPGVLSPPPSIEPESASDPDSTSEENEEQQKSQMDFGKFVNQGEIVPDTDAMSFIQKQSSDCRLLWEFIHQLLQNPYYKEFVCWEKKEDYVFRINNPTGLAQLWGHQKNRTNMTYEKLSRALRYYYRMNIIKKVSGKRLTYKFMQAPSNIQKGQRGAKPHSKCLASILSCRQENVDGLSRDYLDELRTNSNNSPCVDSFSTVSTSVSPNISPVLTSASVELPCGDVLPSMTTPSDFINCDGNSLLTSASADGFKVEPPQDEPQDLSMPISKRKRLNQDVCDNDENPSKSLCETRRLPLLLNYVKSSAATNS